nr:membrane protein m39 [Mastomys natalensis cytomegalovirus 3]WEG69872.1 membrane protein m39 [Mastomys natalensis cytomegalovirus 3]WEG70012.1 membrane protein m39 [Mastomys natalensis cytomegalovirus 3]WEG70152.1 membrane protein m39 [Mastomys natalensis cytomegalovirus 3]WEG70292.1 membrane protein m39 [Mastomys natalensis cytomegalovirus 3]
MDVLSLVKLFSLVCVLTHVIVLSEEELLTVQFTADNTCTRITGFKNGTQVCCRTCRRPVVVCPDRTEVIVVCIIGGFWLGCIVAFIVDRVIGSPLPSSFGHHVRYFIARWTPCLRSIWFPNGMGSSVRTSIGRSERKRHMIAQEDKVITIDEAVCAATNPACEMSPYSDDEFDTTGSGEYDGLDRSAHANVTVHNF